MFGPPEVNGFDYQVCYSKLYRADSLWKKGVTYTRIPGRRIESKAQLPHEHAGGVGWQCGRLFVT